VTEPRLLPGYAHWKRGTASYRGKLHTGPKALPEWLCEHDHVTTASALRCAEAELEQRRQGGRQVFSLLRCESCERWWDDARGVTACPACSVPMARVKVLVLERVRLP
jgi:hypothetical protein